jgi:DNA-binding MarR family transcriptional regulator
VPGAGKDERGEARDEQLAAAGEGRLEAAGDGHLAAAAEGRLEAAAEALFALMVAMLRQLPRDLSWTAASTLATVVRTGPRRVTDLAVLEAVAQPSMTALVGRLERAGLVERRRGPGDQRVVLVAPTKEGEVYVRDRGRLWAETVRALIDKLPPRDARSLVAATPALRRLLELYDGHRGGDPCDEGDGYRPSPGIRQGSPR